MLDAQRKECIKKIEECCRAAKQVTLGGKECCEGLLRELTGIIPESQYDIILARQRTNIGDLEKDVKSVVEKNYNEELYVLHQELFESTHKYDDIWEILFEDIADGNDAERYRGIEKECFQFAVDHISMSSARGVLNKIWKSSPQDRK